MFESAKGVQILDTVQRIAVSDITILVEGETGVGKEVVADLIHRKSARAAGPLVKVNCAALPDALLESELFGFEPGAFTGADRSEARPLRTGRRRHALPRRDRRDAARHAGRSCCAFSRTGRSSTWAAPAPSRWTCASIAATNRDLRTAIAQGRFREDLYYRLNAVTSIPVPPLRARKDDIPALAEMFAAKAAAETHGRKPPAIGFARGRMDQLFRHEWPGNVRELRNVLEQAVVLSTGDTIRAAVVRPALRRRATVAPAPTGASPAGAAAQAPSGISDRQRRLLAALGEREWITNTEYCSLVGVSTRTGLRDLQDLIRRGVLAMEGKRRGARYRLKD